MDENGNRIINKEYLNSLYSMIDLCKTKNAIPILVTTPYLNEYRDTVIDNAPGFLDDFYMMIDNVVKDTGVKYYDYSNDSRFCDNYELFLDVDHLNHEGAVKFVDILMNDIDAKL